MRALTVTCETPGCGNADVPLDVEVPDLDDAGAPAPWDVVCGPCGASLASSATP